MQKDIIKIAYLIFVLFLVCSSPIKAQKIIMADELRLRDGSNSLNNLPQVQSVLFSDMVPDDIEVDHLGNVFIVDKQNDRIVQFSSTLKEEHSIDFKIYLMKKSTISDEVRYLIENHLYRAELEFDSKNNLYLLISINEYYYDLLKFDDTGHLRAEFSLRGNLPQEYMRDFFISKKGIIYINTFPINILNVEYLNSGQVFVYDAEGNYLGRTDYFIEDHNNVSIKRNLLNKNNFQLDFFEQAENDLKTTDKLILKNSLSIPYIKNKSWSFLGIDGNNQLYYIQGRNPLIVRRINSNHEKYDDFTIDEDLYKSKNILFKNEIKNVEVTQSGEILLFCLKIIKDKYSCEDSFNISEISDLILKLEL